MPSKTLLDEYLMCREAKEAADAAQKTAAQNFRTAEQRLMDAMADEGVANVGTDRFAVTASTTLRPRVIGDKALAAALLAEDPSFRDITKVDVNLNTLGALIRERAEQHPDMDPMELLPPAAREHVEIYEQQRLNFRRK
jgi:hypothetical protein